MLNQFIKNFKQFKQEQPLSVAYGIDGILTMGAISIAVNNNALFALRLGAGDFHLSMLQFIPQIMNLLLLIPVGMLADSLMNKRRLLSIALTLTGTFFLIAGASPFISVHAVYFLLFSVAFANVSNAMTNLSWQAFFPEVVDEGDRNNVLTFRARMTMIVSLILPLLVGIVLTSIPAHEGKIRAHQVFYIVSAVLLISNAFHVKRIHATNPTSPKKVNFTELIDSAKRLTKNKPFILFTAAILFFHMTWHVDWTLFFIGQATYLQMNELMLSFTPVVATLMQLISLKFWSRRNARKGVEKGLLFGILGLAMSPLAIIVSTTLPQGLNIAVFLFIHAIGHLAFANITLNLFQCLLNVVDEHNRSFSISVYTCFIMLSNAIMPVLGVALYRGLGGNIDALRLTFMIVFLSRFVAAGVWILYIRYREQQKNK